MGYATNIFGFDDADAESPQSGHIFWPVTGAYAAAVLIIVPIDNVMAAVFDAPVASVGSKDVFRVGLLRRSACDSISEFTGKFTSFLICGFPLDEESLSDVREVEIVIELSCSPYFADFDPAVIRGIAVEKIRVLSIFKIKGDVLKKSGLVVLNGEVVMSVTIPN